MEKVENNLEKLAPTLIEPSIKYKESYLEALKEYQLIDGEDPDILEKIKQNFDAFLNEIDKNKNGLIVEGIPQIKYWCVKGDKYIGNINYRPNMNDKLKFKGGNIGYSIRPSERGKGYASFILSKILDKARADGVSEVMLTCDDDNVASKKIIEKAGGLWQSGDTENGKSFGRYIIKLYFFYSFKDHICKSQGFVLYFLKFSLNSCYVKKNTIFHLWVFLYIYIVCSFY